MPITDRARKLLWGRSGNRCALCRRLLAVDPTHTDPAVLVGEECHIISGSPGGPRFREYPPEMLDAENNLILLCRNDHRRVDAQTGFFSDTQLREVKLAHETWVKLTLGAATHPPPLSSVLAEPDLVGSSQRIPLMAEGQTLLQLVLGGEAGDYGSDELTDETEAELVAGFMDLLHQYGEDGDDMPPGDRVRAGFVLSGQLEVLAKSGFFVFAGRRQRGYPTGMGEIPLDTVIVRVKRVADLILKDLAERPPIGDEYDRTPPGIL